MHDPKKDAEQWAEVMGTRTPFTVDPPEAPGFYFFKPRDGHALGPVRLVQIELRDSQYGPEFKYPAEVGALHGVGKGYWFGPLDMPQGFDAKDTAELFPEHRQQAEG